MKNINFHTSAFLDDKLWFVTVEGYFMNIDIHSMKASFVYVDKKVKLNPVTDKMVVIDKSIYWIEQGGNRLIKYDTNLETCDVYEMGGVEMVDWECFTEIQALGKKIYIIPKCVDKLMIFDTETEQFLVEENKFKKYMNPTGGKSLFDYSIQENSSLYLFCTGQNRVLKYDLDDDKIITIDYSFDMGKVISALKEKNQYYIMTDKCEIYQVDEKFNLKKKMQYEEIYEKSYAIFLKSGANFYILPSLEKDIFVGEQDGNSLKKYTNYPEDLKYLDNGWSKYFRFTVGDGYIWISNRTSNYIARMNQHSGDIEWLHVNVPSVKEEYEYCLYIGKEVFYENSDDIELLMLLSGNKRCEDKLLIGENIWKKVNMKI